MPIELNTVNRIVIKLGTQMVMGEDGQLQAKRLKMLIQLVAQLSEQNKQVIIVTSGAVGLGRGALDLLGKTLTLAQKQACAAIGQTLLMDAYRAWFAYHDLKTAQLLLTAYDFSHRKRYLNLKDTLETLLELGVIPIINENDTVSTTELAEDKSKGFGDNDKLSALVASKLGSDLLVILTNVDGIFTENPEQNPDAQKLDVIEGFSALNTIATSGKSTYGRGGMSSKLEAAKLAAISGVHTAVINGSTLDPVKALLTTGACYGTLIKAQTPVSDRKRWLGWATGFEGIITINEGAKKALLEKHASLLSAGITTVEGDFSAHHVVSITDEQGEELGRGLVSFSAEDVRKISGAHSKDLAGLLGRKPDVDEVIHRDNMVLFPEVYSQ